MSDQLFRWLQSRLTSHGFAVTVDGKDGPLTRKGLKAFQASRGLEPTGNLDQVTTEALRTTSSALPKGVIVPDRDTPAEKATHQPSKIVWPRQADCAAFYGAPGSNLVQIEVPYDMVLAWAPDTRIRKMTLHAKVAASAQHVLSRVPEIYSVKEREALGLHLFGGAFNIRNKRGGKSLSTHAWAVAIDFDPERNQISWGRPKAHLSHSDAVPFWVAWESAGWLSLGRARDFDWMHVQAARL